MGNKTHQLSATKGGKKIASKQASSSGGSRNPREKPATSRKTTVSPPPPPLPPHNLSAQPSNCDGEQLASQQAILDAFAGAYKAALTSSSRDARIQRIKDALYRRDFAEAFAKASWRGDCGEEIEDEDKIDEEEESSLDFYAARWSPTRALCYASVLEGMKDILVNQGLISTNIIGTDDESACPTMFTGEEGSPCDSKNNSPFPVMQRHRKCHEQLRHLNILALGGTPAELAAAASFTASFNHDEAKRPHQYQDQESALLHTSVKLVDLAPWGPAIRKLETQLFDPDFLPLPSSPSTSSPATPSSPFLAPTFHPVDIFSLPSACSLFPFFSPSSSPSVAPAGHSNKGQQEAPSPTLITLLFTLNELYTSSGGMSKPTHLFLSLSAIVPHGSLLLVIDSPGSYCEMAVGASRNTVTSTSKTKEAAAAASVAAMVLEDDAGTEGNKTESRNDKTRKYPMHWLLDYILLRCVPDADADGPEEAGRGEKPRAKKLCKWEKLQTKESVWFRLDRTLKYPMKLEDMRYQMHLYRARR